MKFNDAMLGMILLLFSTAVVFYSKSLPSLPGYKYGSGFFPTITGVILMICGTALSLKGIRSRAKIVTLGSWTRHPKLISNIILVPLNLVFYMIFSEKFGFILTITTMLLATIWWLRGKLLSSIAVSVSVAIFAYTFFYKMMQVPLPMGIFGF